MGRPQCADRRTAILEAAIALAEEGGYAAASIEAVAARAGVGKTTIYRRWTSKAALCVEAYTRLVPGHPPAETDDPLSDLRVLLCEVFRVFRGTPAGAILAGVIVAMPHEPEAAVEIHRQLVIGRRDLLKRPLHRAMAAGQLPADLDVSWACELIVGLIWMRLLTAPATLTDEAADRIVDRLVSGGRR